MINLSPLQSLLAAIAKLVGALVPILITLALVVFFWGLVRYLWGAGGKAGVKKGRDLMIGALLRCLSWCRCGNHPAYADRA